MFYPRCQRSAYFDPVPDLGRMIVFIDGENIVFRFQAMLKKGAEKREGVKHIEDIFVWHTNSVDPRFNIVLKAIYYTTVVGDTPKIEKIAKTIKASPFKQYSPEDIPLSKCLPNRLTPVIFKKGKKQRNTKGLDIQMTVDILTNIYQNNIDVVYLVSGDGDYVPVIEEAFRCGKQVYIAAFSSGLNEKLLLKADLFVDLDKIYFNSLSTELQKIRENLGLPPLKAKPPT